MADTTWKLTRTGQTVYTLHTPRQARLIIGGMLSFFVVFFGYYLVTALVEYTRVASAALWLRALPGLLIVFAIFLAFAIPTYGIFFGRNRVIVDRARGRIVEVFDLPLFRRPKHHPLDQAKAVLVSRKTIRTKGHSTSSNAVQILFHDDEVVTVGWEDGGYDAKMLAEQVRATLGLGETDVVERPVPSDGPWEPAEAGSPDR